MRALQVLILITTMVFTASWLPAVGLPAIGLPAIGLPGSALASSPLLSTPAEPPLQIADARGASRPASSRDDLEYLPKGAPHSEEPSSVGWFLIICAIVVFAVIIGFIIRHHRSGRAG